MKEEKKANPPGLLTAPSRPRAYEQQGYPWNLRHVPHELKVNSRTDTHPGRSCGVFVVHGIGEQAWTETAAGLRSGFEDALEAIQKWQQAQQVKSPLGAKDTIPPPFVFEGFWANYADLQATFPTDWKHFNDRERSFFGYLWKLRAFSVTKTYGWLLKQQVQLLRPAVRKKIWWWGWLLYWPLQVVSFTALTFALIRHPKLLTGFLADVRLYLDPKGLVEKVIVQRIDHRVGQAFLRMIGLDWDFRPLPESQLIEASGRRITFERVVWVAHSLGTVISYNILSDLFHRAAALEKQGDALQKKGVERFRKSLRQFVTMGSPLDKVAFLFGTKSLRPWPKGERMALLEGGETLKKDQSPEAPEWWINFYHVLDPVSGALSSKLICGEEPPANLHIRSGFIPGWAHLAYWKDVRTLRFILSRTYGKTYLYDQEYIPWSAQTLSALAALAYFLWAAILIAGVYAIIQWGPLLVKLVLANARHLLGL